MRQDAFDKKIRKNGVIMEDGKLLVKNLDLSSLDLRRIRIDGVVFDGVKFNGASLYVTDIYNSRFANCEFRSTDLVHCKFENVEIERTVFVRSDCRSMQMNNVVVENVVIEKCDLTNDMSLTSFENVIFREVEFIRMHFQDVYRTAVRYENCSFSKRSRFMFKFHGHKERHRDVCDSMTRKITGGTTTAHNLSIIFVSLGAFFRYGRTLSRFGVHSVYYDLMEVLHDGRLTMW